MTFAGIVAIVLAAVRLIESIFQWWNAEGTKGVVQAVIAILKNFFLSIETYKKK
jgi:hypothetical protein